MDVVVYHRGQPWAAPKLELFTEGLVRHGIIPEIRDADDWRPSDLAVVWGHRDSTLHAIQRSHGGRYLVLERSYIGDLENRRRWTSIGYDGLNGHADFCNEDSPPDRWEQHFSDCMKPWRDNGSYTLIMGQIDGDAATVNVNLPGWYEEAAAALAANWKQTVYLRPHPQAKPSRFITESVIPIIDGTLADALSGASFVATYNSNTGVDAILAGVPAMSCDKGSMVWEMTSHNYSSRYFPDRMQFAHNLAYCQWLPDEIASGSAWEHLRAGA